MSNILMISGTLKSINLYLRSATEVLDVLDLSLSRMAERSAKKKNYGQSYMYLRSAENLITLIEDMNYECSQGRQVVMKLRENVNYSLYIKDYWAISYGHPGLGMHSSMDLSRRPSMQLPNLPDIDNNSNNNINNNNPLDRKNKRTNSFNKNDNNFNAEDLNNNNNNDNNKYTLKRPSKSRDNSSLTKTMLQVEVDVELPKSTDYASEESDCEFTRL